jgi:drug/metabolite transporter superfamily protein YnfA
MQQGELRESGPPDCCATLYMSREPAFSPFPPLCSRFSPLIALQSTLGALQLAAFGAVTMAFNVLLSSLVLKEKFTRVDAIAVLVIASGTVIALSASAAESKDFTLAQILALLDDTAVYVYSSVVGVVILLSALYIERTSKVPVEHWNGFQKWIMAVGSPMVGGLCMGFTG